MRETGVSATNSCFLDVDDLWEEIRAEALHLAGDEPRLASSLPRLGVVRRHRGVPDDDSNLSIVTVSFDGALERQGDE